MTNFFMVRHGETEWNRLGKIQGVSDIPLNENGRRQAAELGVDLQNYEVERIGTSPLSRAQETAQILAESLKLEVPLVIPGLIERDYGEAEGSHGADFYKTFPDGQGVVGRETKEHVTQRVLSSLQELATSSIENYLLVAHGAVIRSLFEHCIPERSFGKISNCSLHLFSMKDGQLALQKHDLER